MRKKKENRSSCKEAPAVTKKIENWTLKKKDCEIVVEKCSPYKVRN
jgi:hypothetical protein